MLWRKSLILAVAGSLLSASAFAKVWLLPDYQQKQYFSERVNTSDAPDVRPSTHVDCHKYGMIFQSEISNGMTCASSNRILNTTCFGNCSCSPSFNKTVSSCRSEGKIPAGDACMDEFFTACICDTSLYPHTSSSCAYTLSGASCSDDDGKHFAECKNPCDGLSDNKTDLGCQSYYKQCPSKCEVGKTCVPNNCSAFPLFSCPAGAVCSSCTPGCGDNMPRYKKRGLSFQVDTPTGGKISFYINGSNYQIDWGDGTINTETQHTYELSGKYDIDVSGNISDFLINSGMTAKPVKLYSLDLPTAKSITLYPACATLTGTIPPLPAGLIDGSNMFYRCSGLSGSIPELPAGLTDGSQMFSGCSGLSGSIPELPAGLIQTYGMFRSCRHLSGSIPKLPAGITEAYGMFDGCEGLSGPIPELPAGITDGSEMFFACSGLSGSVPKLPAGLTTGFRMFDNCTGLSGSIPELPAGLVDGNEMFSYCTGLSGSIPELPSGLTKGKEMFSFCNGLSGTVPKLPAGLVDGSYMFAGCNNLGGQPVKPEALTSWLHMFAGTNVTLTSDWPVGAK